MEMIKAFLKSLDPVWRKVCRESSTNRYEGTRMLYER
jgi:hypothetical protein